MNLFHVSIKGHHHFCNSLLAFLPFFIYREPQNLAVVLASCNFCETSWIFNSRIMLCRILNVLGTPLHMKKRAQRRRWTWPETQPAGGGGSPGPGVGTLRPEPFPGYGSWEGELPPP